MRTILAILLACSACLNEVHSEDVTSPTFNFSEVFSEWPFGDRIQPDRVFVEWAQSSISRQRPAVESALFAVLSAPIGNSHPGRVNARMDYTMQLARIWLEGLNLNDPEDMTSFTWALELTAYQRSRLIKLSAQDNTYRPSLEGIHALERPLTLRWIETVTENNIEERLTDVIINDHLVKFSLVRDTLTQMSPSLHVDDIQSITEALKQSPLSTGHTAASNFMFLTNYCSLVISDEELRAIALSQSSPNSSYVTYYLIDDAHWHEYANELVSRIISDVDTSPPGSMNLEISRSSHRLMRLSANTSISSNSRNSAREDFISLGDCLLLLVSGLSPEDSLCYLSERITDFSSINPDTISANRWSYLFQWTHSAKWALIGKPDLSSDHYNDIFTAIMRWQRLLAEMIDKVDNPQGDLRARLEKSVNEWVPVFGSAGSQWSSLFEEHVSVVMSLLHQDSE